MTHLTGSSTVRHIERLLIGSYRLREEGSMAWRVIEAGEEVWHVQPAAEMRPDAQMWQLTLSFRAAKTDREPRSFWASYPLESNSKSSLFQAADRLTNDTLKEVLAQHVV